MKTAPSRVIPKIVPGGEPVLFLPDELAVVGTVTAFSPHAGRKSWPIETYRAAKPLDGSRLWCFVPLLAAFQEECRPRVKEARRA